ncbi:hypothetical protein L596_030936 [Steinernema carpocapsae]|uniref:Uncharacterized protein n=1 Tax=Steinernema carpocapsae TaxID=34508 RepID=A0A4U5MHA2_STECR|nr:hypothetical protein L596_030936 [Steinernema carpocapsae]
MPNSTSSTGAIRHSVTHVIWLSDTDDEDTCDSTIPGNQGEPQNTVPTAEDNPGRYASIDRRLDAVRSIDPLKDLVTALEDRSLGLDSSSSTIRTDGAVDQCFANIANVLADTAAKLDPLEDSLEEAARRNGGPVPLWLQADCEREMCGVAKRLRLLQMALTRMDPAEAAADDHGTSSCSKRDVPISDDLKSLEALRTSISFFEEEISKITDEETKHVFQEKLEEARTEALQIKVDYLRLKLRKEVLKDDAISCEGNAIGFAEKSNHQAAHVEERPANLEQCQERIESAEEPVMEDDVIWPSVDVIPADSTDPVNQGETTSNGRQKKRQKKSKLEQRKNPITAEISESIDLRIQAVFDFQRLNGYIDTIEWHAKNNWGYALAECDRERGRIMKMVNESINILGVAEEWRKEAERRLGQEICTWTAQEFEAERKANSKKVKYLRGVLSGKKNPAEAPKSGRRKLQRKVKTETSATIRMKLLGARNPGESSVEAVEASSEADEKGQKSPRSDKTSGKVLVNSSFISRNMRKSTQPMMPLRNNSPMASHSDLLLPNFSVPPPSVHSLPPPRIHTIAPRMVIRNENWENAVDLFLKHDTVPDNKPHPNKRGRSSRSPPSPDRHEKRQKASGSSRSH